MVKVLDCCTIASVFQLPARDTLFFLNVLQFGIFVICLLVTHDVLMEMHVKKVGVN